MVDGIEAERGSGCEPGRMVTERMIREMIERVDGRLLPLCRCEGFQPGESVVRLGDDGYVTEAEFDAALADEPDWAAACYQLDGNQRGRCKVWAELYNEEGVAGLEEALTRLFRLDQADVLYCTEADENGHC